MFHRTAYFLGELRKNQWRTKEELEELQLEKLKKMVEHAYSTVPYYRDLFRKNKLLPSHIKRLEDIEKIPVTSKKDLLSKFPNYITSSSIDIKKCTFEQTAGSTGMALNVARSPETKDYELSLVLHAFFECGLKLSDTMMAFDDPRNFGKDKKGFLNYLGILRKNKESVFDDTPKLLKSIQRTKPDVIYSYPSILFLISQKMRKEKIHLKKTPRLIFTTSETLYGNFRSSIEEQFGASVYDQYGSTEFPRIGWQCLKKEGMHINADSHILEFLKKGRPVDGKRGAITITSLYNYGMPFLRYSISDVSESMPGECSCGRCLPLMKGVEGRTDDFLVDAKGNTLSPKIIRFELDEFKGLKEYRLVQKSAGKATLFIVKGEHFSEKTLAESVERIEEMAFGQLKLKVLYKNGFACEKRKVRPIISSVKPDFLS